MWRPRTSRNVYSSIPSQDEDDDEHHSFPLVNPRKSFQRGSDDAQEVHQLDFRFSPPLMSGGILKTNETHTHKNKIQNNAKHRNNNKKKQGKALNIKKMEQKEKRKHQQTNANTTTTATTTPPPPKASHLAAADP